MNPKLLHRWVWFLILLTVAGGWFLWLCSRFSGFRHPLTLPVLLGGISITAAFLLLLLHPK